MASWNNPTDVSSGTALTALLWNNQLGTNGSLKYLYDNLSSIATPRNVVLWKSTNTAVSTTSTTNISFDTVVTTYASMQQNFPVTVPVTAIPIPQEGMYNVTFYHGYTNSTSATGNVSLAVTDGTNTFYYYMAHRDLNTSHNTFLSPFTIYAMPSSTITLRVQYDANRTILSTAITGTTGASHLLTITKVN